MQLTGRIRQLSQQVINQIAAGEIIERTASVVKELVENSIDAGAKRIEVEIEQGGQDLIRVSDDGHGIYPDDLAMALASHATSKLQSTEDLLSVQSLGFRGEALASISSVAKVLIQSCPHDLTQGAKITSNGEVISSPMPWNGSPGTTVEVRHLFFNSPVRRKFLKSPAADTAQITEILFRMILSRAHGTFATPHLQWVYKNKGKTVYQIPPETSFLEQATILFGENISKELLPIEETMPGCRLTGFIGSPNLDQGSTRYQFFFLNGRWFRDKSVAHALQEGFKGHLMTGRYPVVFLYLDLAPDKVDVNVHPAKSEVRFREPGLIHHMVHNAIKKSLAQFNPSFKYAFSEKDPQWPFGAPVTEHTLPGSLSKTSSNPPEFQLNSGSSPGKDLPFPPTKREPIATFHDTQIGYSDQNPPEIKSACDIINEIPSDRFWQNPSKVIQFFDSYILLETEEGMLVIDQHALHERVLYEQLKLKLQDGKIPRQKLLIPETFDLSESVIPILLENLESFSDLGFDIRNFGGNTLLVDGIPAILGKKSPKDLVVDIVDHLFSKGSLPSRESLLHKIMSLTACHSAVRSGDKLTNQEMELLAQKRHLSKSNYHCPHGRPTALLITRSDLERQFGRT